MLFFLYLISVIFSVVIIHLMTVSFFEKLENDGIKIIENKSLCDKIKTSILLLIEVCLPLFNIIHVLYIVSYSRKIYQRIIEKLFLQGSITFKSDRL